MIFWITLLFFIKMVSEERCFVINMLLFVYEQSSPIM